MSLIDPYGPLWSEPQVLLTKGIGERFAVMVWMAAAGPLCGLCLVELIPGEGILCGRCLEVVPG